MSENRHIAMGEIDADEKFNCRGVISTIDVVELARDIKEKGLLQPVIVTEYPEPKGRKKYRLIGGFRRYTAHQVNQAETIWCTIMPFMDEETATIMNLSENLNRQDLTIMQEANALRRLRSLGCAREETAKRLNKTPGWVQIRFMLLNLPKEVQQEVDAGIIKQTDIRDLYSIRNAVGDKQCIDAARKLKEAKAKGVKANIKPKSKTTKKVRMKIEINEMMDIIYGVIGPSLATRCLAWCGGEISDGELFQSIKEEASDTLDKTFIAPW